MVTAPTPSLSLAERYLRTIKRSLLNDFYIELEGVLHYLQLCRRQGSEPDVAVLHDIAGKRPDILSHLSAARDDGNLTHWPSGDGAPYDPRTLSEQSHTMIGRKRLDHLHACLDTILDQAIPGDLIETGVWRGGATIFMRAHLAAHGVKDRRVWVADSFVGLPEPSVSQDAGLQLSRQHYPFLAVDEARVRGLFERYDLLDDQVRFLPGWFRDTLPDAPITELALLRLDGDLYESTMDALLALYDKVAPGGFVVADDYGAVPACRQAVDDFRAERGIATPLETIDWTGVAWRKDVEAAPAVCGMIRGNGGRNSGFTVIRRPPPPLDQCRFYHTADLPEGTIPGDWDLRPNVNAYLGGVPLEGRSVLEIGPASGFLSFHMERSGASVTAVEPSMERLWDAFPLHGFDMDAWRSDFLGNITQVRNSFWYLHHRYRSTVRLIETVPESIPEAVGDFDIGLLGAILLHVRSPFSILESVAARVRDTMIVTELYDIGLGELPVMRLIPWREAPGIDTWWSFSPNFFIRSLECLGFPHAELSVHHQIQGDRLIPMFTIVARR
ncbi:class I SAM-dependent methyltransferase [Azospirillum thermophilum]|uniref:Macrocin O-methyltransferase n=1 Tax=Azospirillum thermophilum TaxID=2202148 RepID=A0A2S2CYX2_9PROT|nr:TylF/MycF/NovP-related O-methyltransferase [Azospirillum thermophilum]AWK89635.1 macrocin O-methyltransferase [Azospirillum thermophilum]